MLLLYFACFNLQLTKIKIHRVSANVLNQKCLLLDIYMLLGMLLDSLYKFKTFDMFLV